MRVVVDDHKDVSLRLEIAELRLFKLHINGSAKQIQDAIVYVLLNSLSC